MVHGAAVRRRFLMTLDEEDENVESEHQQKAIGNKDAGDAGRGDENVLEVEGREERADEKDR